MRVSCLALVFSLLAFAGSAGAKTLKVLALEQDAFFYQKTGKVTGIEHDILDYFARTRNATLEIEWVDSFGRMLERIEKGEADLAAGTITITPERTRRIDFSVSYFPVQVVLVEKIDANTRSLTELVGRKVAAFVDTTAEDALRAVPGILIVNDGTLQEQMSAIVRGELHAAAADSSAVIPELDRFPQLKVGMTLGAESGFGFALPKGSPLTGPLTEHIKKLKESGIYFRLVSTHMGPRASEIVKAAKIE
jgi:polar amino acid transport system substrate-binding protein